MENRNYKDSVFVDLFAKDISAHKNFISLYNALHKKTTRSCYDRVGTYNA